MGALVVEYWLELHSTLARWHMLQFTDCWWNGMVRNGMQLSVVAASVAVQDSVTSCTDRTVDCSCNDTATTTTEHGPSQPESIKSVQDERRVVMTVPVRHCWFLVHAFPLVCRNLFRALDCLVLLVVVLVDTRPTCSTGQCVPSSL